MKQINIRVTDKEYRVLELNAERKGISVTSLFKTIISDSFEEWKISELLGLYAEGQIRFKEIVRLSGWSYAALMRKFDELGMEPPVIDTVERRSEEITENITPASILKRIE